MSKIIRITNHSHLYCNLGESIYQNYAFILDYGVCSQTFYSRGKNRLYISGSLKEVYINSLAPSCELLCETPEFKILKASASYYENYLKVKFLEKLL